MKRGATQSRGCNVGLMRRQPVVDLFVSQTLTVHLLRLRMALATYLQSEQDSDYDKAKHAACELHQGIREACETRHTVVVHLRSVDETCVVCSTGPLNPDGFSFRYDAS